MRPPHAVRRLAPTLVLVLGAAGCALFAANNRELVSAQARLASGDAPGALDALDPGRRDDLCARLDRATILAALGRVRESNAEFDRALDRIRERERRAVVSAREVGRTGASLVVNDKAFEYAGEGWETVLVHTYKARNHLLLGDLEGALVEAKNADRRQDEERRRHGDAIDRTHTGGLAGAGLDGEIDRQFAPYREVLRRLDSAYRNPFATWLAGVVYELSGQLDDAFIDYEQAYRTAPNPLIRADLARLAATLGRDDVVASLGVGRPDGTRPPGDTLVIVDNGSAPHRVELKFPVPAPDTLLFVAVPMTRPVPSDVGETQVIGADGAVLGETHVMADVEAMAVRSLRDRYPAIVARQLARAAGKAFAAHAATEHLGVGGFVLTTAFNAVTEQADLRTWYALPRSIHAARVDLPDGAAEVRLRFLGPSGGVRREYTAPVVPVTPHLNLVVVRYLNGTVLASAPAVRETAADRPFHPRTIAASPASAANERRLPCV